MPPAVSVPPLTTIGRRPVPFGNVANWFPDTRHDGSLGSVECVGAAVIATSSNGIRLIFSISVWSWFTTTWLCSAR